jgi:hypothetical protein
MSQNVCIVGTGIDTIKVNVKVTDKGGKPTATQTILDTLLAVLQDRQDQARVNKKPVALGISFHDAPLVVLPNGAPEWKYIARNDCLEVKIAPRLKVPMIARVTFLSAYLWEVGHVQSAVKEVSLFLEEVFGVSLLLQAAQIDLCVDLVGLTLPTEWERVFVTHAIRKRPIAESQKDKAYYRGRKLETLLFSGHGRPVSCKIYNKVIEIKQQSKDKEWFHDIWKQHGWDGDAPVWRVEFSLERPCLREMDLEGIEETVENIQRLWDYCTQEWLRMVVPGTSKNRTRWQTHPTWELLQSAFEAYGNEEIAGLGPLVRERKRVVNLEQAVAALAGYSTTYGAWEDLDFDEEGCALEVFTLIYEKVLERWAKLGVSPVDIIREKKFLYSRTSQG